MPSANNLTAEVEGDIEDVNGVLKITRIRLRYRIDAPAGKRAAIERLLDHYAEACPAYQSVKGCIDCSWTAEIAEGPEG
ncbi:OsmC family protein [Tautonia sp. JC769]|uniref:OsmC family protein n=1 Tax=Tautonia sp. JC769 TaxID=3232135 RepID=UPI003457BDA9